MLGLPNEGSKYHKLTEIIKQTWNSLKVLVIGAFTVFPAFKKLIYVSSLKSHFCEKH